MTSRFRFGVHTIGPASRADLVDVARAAEDRGFAVLTVADHLVDGCIAPFVALGLVAEATTTLRLGTLVLNNDLRHPAVVAKEALALDALSGGRFELGVGAGHGFPEYESTGMTFDRAGVRIDRLAESVDVLDQLLRGEEVWFGGDHYTFAGHRSWPAPTQSPRLPLVVGGNGRRLLGLAARKADIVGLSGTGRTKSDGLSHEATGFPAASVDERIALVRAAATDRTVELNALVQSVIVTDEPTRAAEELLPLVPDLSVDDLLGTPYVWIGSVESICDDAASYRERWGFSYFTIFDRSADAARPIVERLAGR